ncbi:MAG: hypothetical protein NTY09_07785 [bacterium]|nr:hypothetical protein [bacterium]
MFKNLTAIIILFACLVIMNPALADSELNEEINRISYINSLIGGGVNYYYLDTGSLPGSVNELYATGWIPGNLVNPVTDEPFNYNSVERGPGEIIITPVDNQHVILYIGLPNGQEFENDLESSMYSTTNYTGSDLRVANYRYRVQFSFFQYWRVYQDLPTSIDDMKDKGFWPFDGSELNPYTFEPLRFDDSNPGNLRFSFDLDEVMCRVYFQNNGVGAAGFDREYGETYFEF